MQYINQNIINCQLLIQIIIISFINQNKSILLKMILKNTIKLKEAIINQGKIMSELSAGERLKQVRIEKNMTQTELAERWGITKLSIINYEKSDELSTFVAIATEHLYGYTERWVLTGKGDKHYKSTISSEDRYLLEFLKKMKHKKTDIYTFLMKCMEDDFLDNY